MPEGATNRSGPASCSPSSFAGNYCDENYFRKRQRFLRLDRCVQFYSARQTVTIKKKDEL
jgi:hypothetical protein